MEDVKEKPVEAPEEIEAKKREAQRLIKKLNKEKQERHLWEQKIKQLEEQKFRDELKL